MTSHTVSYFLHGDSSGREATARNVPPAIASELERRFGAQRNGAAIQARPLLAVPAAADAAQDVNMWIELRVADAEGVSSGAQEAMRITRGLGGVVASSTVATRGGKGQADLRLRIPTGRLEDALVSLSRLGTVTSQRVDTEDLQSRLGQTEGRIEALRSAIKIELARLASGQLSAEEELGARIHLVHLRRRLADVGRLHAAFARQAPGAADKAVDVLRSAGSVVVFLAIVLSPLLVLLVLASLALRARSRRVEAELLAEPRPGGPSRERSS